MTMIMSPSGIGLDTAAELAAQLRVDSIRASTSTGSGLDADHIVTAAHRLVEVRRRSE